MKTVLLADLDNPHRAMLERELSRPACTVVTAGCADEVVALARWPRFDMIIVDVAVLPLGKGRTLGELCFGYVLHPLLVLTCGLRERRWLDTPRPCGCDSRLVKVVDPRSLARRLEAHGCQSTPPRCG